MADIKTFEDFEAKARKVHHNKYTYSKQGYVDRRTPIRVICDTHGEYTQRPSNHLAGNGCPECGRSKANKSLTSSTNKFVQKAKAIHGDKYTYDNTVYVTAKTPVAITCRKHGDFMQVPNTHLDGSGCRQCRTESIGWEDSKWELQSIASNVFSGYTVYVIYLYNDNESFYKIGRTFVPIKNRMKDLVKHYKYEVVLTTVTAKAKDACELERKLHSSNRSNRYTPKMKFGGYTECYSTVNIEGHK